jgi:hypothetical protein
MSTQPSESDVLRRQVQGLRQAMQSRAAIEQAVGILVAVQGTDPETAFENLVWMSQHHNIKLRRLAAVLIESTIEVGPDTAASLLYRLNRDDPRIEEATERNEKRVPKAGELLPASAIEAARELVTARDAAQLDRDGSIDERLSRARNGFYAELIRLGWVPPFPVPAEISEVVGDYPAPPDQPA